MSDLADKLSAKQHKALTALMVSNTIADAAAAIGVNERTVYTWLDDPMFAGAYRAVLDEALSQARARLLQLSGTAVATLERNMTCGKPAIEVSAANSILDKALKFKELEDLAERMAALEAAYAAKL
jgi:hypothetical protein